MRCLPSPHLNSDLPVAVPSLSQSPAVQTEMDFGRLTRSDTGDGGWERWFSADFPAAWGGRRLKGADALPTCAFLVFLRLGVCCDVTQTLVMNSRSLTGVRY